MQQAQLRLFDSGCMTACCDCDHLYCGCFGYPDACRRLRARQKVESLLGQQAVLRHQQATRHTALMRLQRQAADTAARRRQLGNAQADLQQGRALLLAQCQALAHTAGDLHDS